MPQPIHLNGINSSTGQALDDFRLTTEQLAKIARKKRLFEAELREVKLRNAQDQHSAHHFGCTGYFFSIRRSLLRDWSRYHHGLGIFWPQ